MTEILPNLANLPFSPTMDRLLDPNRSTILEQQLISRLKLDYSQPHRKHHTFEHITKVIAFLDENHADLVRPNVAVWAALYHDAIYDPMAAPGENEKASAKLAVESLSGAMDTTDLERVEKYILATANHALDSNDPDIALLVDADLSILGASAKEYKQYATNIRSEYDQLGDGDYAKGRI